MKAILVSFGAGNVFALGVGIGGMTQPAKVIGFLDFAGNWDPSLAFVMLGAIGVYAVASRATRKRSSPVLAAAFSVPLTKDIDFRLVAGASVFGLGWGIAGFCPAPGLTSIPSGRIAPVIFSLAMIAGMAVYKATDKLRVPDDGTLPTDHGETETPEVS